MARKKKEICPYCRKSFVYISMIGKWMDIWKVIINGEVYKESRKILVRVRPKPTGQPNRYGVFRKKNF